MKTFGKSTNQKVKKECDRLVVEMLLTKDLDQLNLLKQRYQVYSEMLKSSWSITPDTIVIVSANLIGILLILNYEKLDIISSKAIGFVLKGRV